jgi:hypothetical protein
LHAASTTEPVMSSTTFLDFLTAVKTKKTARRR